MRDPEFHEPAGKPAAAPVSETVPPNCKLAVVSLVFGILGYVPLLLVGALVAIVTGHIAMGEIRASEGRLGGRSAAKAGLVLGYIWFVLAVLAGLIVLSIFWFTTRPESMVYRTMTPAPSVRESPGVKMANEMSQRDFENLKKLEPAALPENEDIIAYFNHPDVQDGEPEMAVLTSKRIVYLKGDRVTSFDLKEIDAVLDGPAYKQKYTPQYFGTTPYMIEIKRKTGGRMRIAIDPDRDGPLFGEALNDAWKSAGGKPEEALKK